MTKPIPTDWKQVKLGKYVKIFNGGAFSSLDATDHGARWLKIANAGIGKIKWNDESFLPTEFLDSNKKYCLQSGDIVLALTRPTLGNKLKIAEVTKEDENSLLNQRVGKLLCSKDLNKKLAYYFLRTEEAAYRINQQLTGTDPPNLSSKAFNFIPFLLPSLPEQHRIVAVLETWDKAIDSLTRKIEIKKNIKKGLMQELMTGKRRLAGFSGEWKTVKLGEIGNTFAGLTGKTKEDFGDGDPFISYMNIFSNLRIPKELSERVTLAEGEKQQEVKYGDMLFTTSSETPEEVGVCSILLYQPKEPTYLNSFCFGLRPNNFEILLPEFAQFYFNSRVFRKKMARLAQGASRYNLSKKYFVDTSIEIPKSKEEQTAIAHILTTTDDEITALGKKKQILEDQKKYLLNNLITGQIRTPENLTMDNQ